MPSKYIFLSSTRYTESVSKSYQNLHVNFCVLWF